MPPRTALTQLADGSYFDLLDPNPAQINADMICDGLLKIHRFNGRTIRPYTVLEHSLRAAWFFDRLMAEDYPHPSQMRRAVLLHDAQEVFMGDIIAPTKQALRALGGEAALHKLEQGLDRAIELAFGLPHLILNHPAIKDCDLMALEWERRNVKNPMGGRETPPEWPLLPERHLREVDRMREWFPKGDLRALSESWLNGLEAP